MQPILFYDIPFQVVGETWSPNTWRTRYSLNYKNLPYTTIWVEYPDIAALYTETLRIPPSTTLKSGKPYYSLPVIHDPNTGETVSDSMRIAEYLDKTYPSSGAGPIIPAGTRVLQQTFQVAYDHISTPMVPIIIPRIPAVLNPRSREYFLRTREVSFGKPLAEVLPKGEEHTAKWAETKAAFAKIDGWIQASGGPFMMGDIVSLADFVVAGEMHWVRIALGADSDEWKEWAEWNDGRWAKLLANLEKYEGQDNL
ncbi:GST N-terminal domain-containing protein [Mycena indigotica]|uniref:GST N-terminal domain-containing protein n=1 Tax=Mycena indigotica TaxID=2126181 RepID=A0A8H6W2F7_9AGAR|nr:GST N-terminal domain-containing protein [Mycena indigotica]KAF7299208.1 GST N-terminal domain-containing protein [Mycena indigotica]